MSQDRTALIHRALRNLGVLPQGQSPSAEEYQSIDDLIDPMIANLVERNIMMRGIRPRLSSRTNFSSRSGTYSPQ